MFLTKEWRALAVVESGSVLGRYVGARFLFCYFACNRQPERLIPAPLNLVFCFFPFASFFFSYAAVPFFCSVVTSIFVILHFAFDYKIKIVN